MATNRHPTAQQNVPARDDNARTKGCWARASAAWPEYLRHLPERAQPFFAEPPSSLIEDFPDYINLVRLVVTRTDCSDLMVLLRAQDLVHVLWHEKALRRCCRAIVEREMRPAARALLEDLLSDGERSAAEVTAVATKYAHQALKDSAGLAQVQTLVPGFDMQLVEAEAMRRSFETMEALAKNQAVHSAQKHKAIDSLQCAETEAEEDRYGAQVAEELLGKAEKRRAPIRNPSNDVTQAA